MKSSKLQKINDKIKVYFIDLDGTLLNTKKNGKKFPSEENIKQIEKIKLQNKKAIVSTGKYYDSAKFYSNLIGSDFVISSNGAQIHDSKGNLIKEFFLDKKDVEIILEIAKKEKVMLGIAKGKQLFGVKSIFRQMIIKLLGWNFRVNYNIKKDEPIYKIFFLDSKKKLKKIENNIKEKKLNISIVFQGPILEFTHKKATKGKAAKIITELLKLNKEQTAHIGDTGNDATAAKYVNALIAVKNADKYLLSSANYIGPSSKKNGVAKILSGKYYEFKK